MDGWLVGYLLLSRETVCSDNTKVVERDAFAPPTHKQQQQQPEEEGDRMCHFSRTTRRRWLWLSFYRATSSDSRNPITLTIFDIAIEYLILFVYDPLLSLLQLVRIKCQIQHGNSQRTHGWQIPLFCTFCCDARLIFRPLHILVVAPLHGSLDHNITQISDGLSSRFVHRVCLFVVIKRERHYSLARQYLDL